MYDQFHLLALILAQLQHPVASIKALDLRHWAMHAVLYRRTAAAIETAIKVGPFFHHCFICCCPGSRWGWGNMKQVVAQWWHPVASGVHLDMPHQAMPSVLLQRACMATKMACNGVAFNFCTMIVAKDHVMVN
jgi:hypothetical protein